ncbi:hypothetical protein [Tengunoibacter tsumagoiensis]|uniref:Uncharacterized protein n=1 Tax=Tengunoibacter tsumagoiensis TaxID=2014871 RepID=A0A402A942_9CHLR|nr:hypothetical protein [Tengunoibacter tsumagoiensis]GCE15461.1 hypothetical protein KTT_53200 [Tengunoibacter tsumagoiensis]
MLIWQHIVWKIQGSGKIIGSLALMLSLLILMSACSEASSSQTSSQTVTMHTSWAEYYTSLKELKQHSDVVVRGTIAEIGTTYKPTDGPVYTPVTVSITQIISKPQNEDIPAKISLVQTGGKYKNVTYQVDDDPLFQKGEQVILFLKEYKPGKFRISGGPTGRFKIANGTVLPVVSDGVQLSPSTTDTQFASNLQNV